jgi:hypothetical protein
MFVIIVPACMAPALAILFWADLKAKRLGGENCVVPTPGTPPEAYLWRPRLTALSVAGSTWAQRQHLEGQKDSRTFLQMVLHYWSVIDGFGLILLATGFALLLLPFTLYSGAEKGWKNRKFRDVPTPRRLFSKLSSVKQPP